MTHQPSPSANAPSSIASSAPALAQPMNSNPRGSVIEIPSFLPLASSTSPGTSAAADSNSPFAAADFSSAPGMALTQEQNSEPLELPSFLDGKPVWIGIDMASGPDISVDGFGRIISRSP